MDLSYPRIVTLLLCLRTVCTSLVAMMAAIGATFMGDFETHTWRVVETSGKVPRSRYRGTCVVHDDRMILHGGHDNKHLQDTHIYNFTTCIWSEVPCTDAPSPRDTPHWCSMRRFYVYSWRQYRSRRDFHELNLEKNVWRTVRYQTVADMGVIVVLVLVVVVVVVVVVV